MKITAAFYAKVLEQSKFIIIEPGKKSIRNLKVYGISTKTTIYFCINCKIKCHFWKKSLVMCPDLRFCPPGENAVFSGEDRKSVPGRMLFPEKAHPRHQEVNVFMKLSRKEYAALYGPLSPASPSYKTVPAAFLVGGSICALGQGLKTAFLGAGLEEASAGTAVSCTLILLGVLLTALRLFEKLARFAGAGTLVPITGFANSIASPALEFKTEGLVLGACVKMFSIAGPVLTFGVTASVIYGLLLYFFGGCA